MLRGRGSRSAHGPRRRADHHRTSGLIAGHHGPGTYGGPGPDLPTLEHAGVGSDRHAAAQGHCARDVRSGEDCGLKSPSTESWPTCGVVIDLHMACPASRPWTPTRRPGLPQPGPSHGPRGDHGAEGGSARPGASPRATLGRRTAYPRRRISYRDDEFSRGLPARAGPPGSHGSPRPPPARGS